MPEWKLWAKERPPDGEKKYRWRIPEQMVLGMNLRPEWVAKLESVGMGYSDNEWWPLFSHWDGYRRTIPKGTEWRDLEEGEDEAIIWNGLDLLPCPFSGKPPHIDYHGQWIGAPPYRAEYLILSFRFGTSRWTNVETMQNAWNTRA